MNPVNVMKRHASVARKAATAAATTAAGTCHFRAVQSEGLTMPNMRGHWPRTDGSSLARMGDPRATPGTPPLHAQNKSDGDQREHRATRLVAPASTAAPRAIRRDAAVRGGVSEMAERAPIDAVRVRHRGLGHNRKKTFR